MDGDGPKMSNTPLLGFRKKSTVCKVTPQALKVYYVVVSNIFFSSLPGEMIQFL